MTDEQFRRRLIAALERIADALERANEIDPLAAIDAALAGEQPDPPTTDQAGSASPLPPSEQWRTR